MGVRAESRRLVVASEGRVCYEEGCGTRLSIYNSIHWCAVHERAYLNLVRLRQARRWTPSNRRSGPAHMTVTPPRFVGA